MADSTDSYRQKLRAALVSVGVNTTLILVKVLVGLATGSLGIIAEAGHSISDLTASIFAFWGIREAGKPPDPDHHYGHEKYENLSSLFQMGVLLVITLYIFYEVAQAALFGHRPSVTLEAIGIMLLAMVVDLFTARYLGGMATRHGSPALEADAFHFLTDMWSALAVLVGVAGAWLGQYWMDSVAAVVVALAMLRGAHRLGRDSAARLVDAAPGPEITDRIREIVAGHHAVLGHHSLRLRQAGNKVLVDLCIHLDPTLSVSHAHSIAHDLERQIQAAVPSVREAVVHVEPLDDHDDGRHA